MKSLLMGAAAAAAIVLCFSSANAADGSKLVAACKASVDNKTLPQGVSAEAYTKFCACLVTKAGDNQAVIDEHTGIATASAADSQAKIAASSDTAKANAAACATESGMTPPPAQ